MLKMHDLHEIITFMDEIKPPIIGFQTNEIYKKFCNYVFKTNRVVFAVATFNRVIIGFSITIIDYKRFWQEFLFCHPYLAMKIVIKKIIVLFKRSRNDNVNSDDIDISPYLSKNANNRSWSDSSPTIGKVLYIAVNKNFRKQGVGKGLYKFRHKILLEMGIKRVDGKINQNNIAPIRLAHSEGRTIIREKNGMLFTTFDL